MGTALAIPAERWPEPRYTISEGRLVNKHHPDDIAAVMRANRSRLFGIATAVQTAIRTPKGDAPAEAKDGQ